MYYIMSITFLLPIHQDDNLVDGKTFDLLKVSIAQSK